MVALQWCVSFSVQFSHSVVSSSLPPHGLQHARLPCPSPTRRACSNSCPMSQWCHPTISSSAVPFSSCLQSFPASGSFSNESVLRIRWPKCWRFSFNISPSTEYSGLISFRSDWFDLTAIQGSLKSLLQHQNSKAYSGHYQGIRRRVWKKEGGWSHKRKGISDWERYGSSEASWRSIYAEG